MTKIGIFDSGIGGLTVLNELATAFPTCEFIYVGDTQRAPYGNKSVSELWKINLEILDFLLSHHVDLIVMGCNTSCSLFFTKLQSTTPIPIIELISPAAKKAINVTHSQHIGVLATQRTVESHAYQTAIHTLNSTLSTHEQACPKLVPYVESNHVQSKNAIIDAKAYLHPLISANCDTIILGCTHYPYFESVWRQFPHLNWIDPAETVIETARTHLGLPTSPTLPSQANITLYISGPSPPVQNALSHFFPNLEKNVTLASVPNFKHPTPIPNP